MTHPDKLPIWDKWRAYTYYPKRVWFTPSSLVEPKEYWKREYLAECSPEAIAGQGKVWKEENFGPWSEFLKWKKEAEQAGTSLSKEWDDFMNKAEPALSRMQEKGADLHFISGCVVGYLWEYGEPEYDPLERLSRRSATWWQRKVKRLERMAAELESMSGPDKEFVWLPLLKGDDFRHNCRDDFAEYADGLREYPKLIRIAGLDKPGGRPILSFGAIEVEENGSGRVKDSQKNRIKLKLVKKRSGPVAQVKLNMATFMLAEYNRQKTGRPMWGEITQVLESAGLKIGLDPEKLDQVIDIEDKKKWLRDRVRYYKQHSLLIKRMQEQIENGLECHKAGGG